LGLIQEAVESGARLSKACEILGLDTRTVQRWRKLGIGEDRRTGPKTTPANKLSQEEVQQVCEVLTAPQYRDLSPNQIVPRLADEGIYLASESTMYRILRKQRWDQHRESSKPAQARRPRELLATGPNQVWSWDITYLRSPVRGSFYYLYLIVDVFSRKIVAKAIYEYECQELAAALIVAACAAEGINPGDLVLHSDNGGPMKGATMVATLEALGVLASFSRPRVSDDNPYSESLFRTLKYRPEYPSQPFDSLEAARKWVDGFIAWYNHEHLHSAIRFVTPAQRHAGLDHGILEARHEVYMEARDAHPERWSGSTRDWSRVEAVRLNPTQDQAAEEAA